MPLHYTASTVARFWPKIDRSVTGCWLWTRARRNGYGVLNNREGQPRVVYAHVLSYVLHKGPVPPGLMVLHTCDVRHCVNPTHLYAGDFSENIRDAWNRRRRPRPVITARDAFGRIRATARQAQVPPAACSPATRPPG
jgi:hypothetical protein